MKKMIVSLMLIISMFAFAAESAPSATVGYVKYSNVVTAGTDLNHIAIPVTNSWTLNSNIDPSGTYYSAMSKWNATTQTWQTSSRGPVSWLSTFAVTPGMGLSLSAKSNNDLIVAGTVNAIPAYSLITTAGTDLNFIMHPLTKASITTSAALGDNIGVANVSSISRWNSATQAYQTTSRGPVSWLGSYTIDIAQALMLSMKTNISWPTSKLEEGGIADDSQSNAPKGNPRQVFYGCLDGAGNIYDFSAAPYDNITFKAYITARPTEIQNQNSFDSGYDAMGGIVSCVFTNVGNFATPWSAGETLHFIVKDEVAKYEDYGDFLLDASTDPVFLGLDEAGWGGGPALRPSTAHPASIEEGMLPAETKLHQNYPNPFNPTTAIRFDLATAGNVKLNVYNYNGQLLQSLVNGTMSAGVHSVNFDASSLSAGVYYYALEAGNRIMSNKMILVK